MWINLYFLSVIYSFIKFKGSSSIHTFENKQNATIYMKYHDQIQRKNYMWQMEMQSWLTIIIKSPFMRNFFF